MATPAPRARPAPRTTAASSARISPTPSPSTAGAPAQPTRAPPRARQSPTTAVRQSPTTQPVSQPSQPAQPTQPDQAVNQPSRPARQANVAATPAAEVGTAARPAATGGAKRAPAVRTQQPAAGGLQERQSRQQPTTAGTRPSTTSRPQVDDFPYKALAEPRSSITDASIQHGLENTSVSVFTQVPLATLSLSIPGLTWNFKGVDNVAIMIPRQVYWDLDRLTDYFSEHVRVRANVKDNISPYDFWQQNKEALRAEARAEIDKKSAISASASDNPDYPKLTREQLILQKQRDLIHYRVPEATQFKISLTAALLRYLKAHKVLDPSAGWGDRLLGAAFTPTVDVYHGVDPNTALTSAYDRILDYLQLGKYDSRPGKANNFAVVTADFLKVELDDKYDTVLTSPPFFDFEVYSDEASQSIVGRNTLEIWTREFYIPYLTKAYNALIPGGRMCLYVANTTQLKGFVETTHDIMNSLLGARYEGAIACGNDLGQTSNNKRGERICLPFWIWSKP